MFLYLDELIFAMEGFANEEQYIDLSVYEYFSEYNLDSHDLMQCVKIPLFNDIDIAKQYIIALNDKSFKRKIDVSSKKEQFIKDLHVALNDSGLYSDYVSFVHQRKIQIAKNWCDKNNIRYTMKRF